MFLEDWQGEGMAAILDDALVDLVRSSLDAGSILL
jgi:hypothetical protein